MPRLFRHQGRTSLAVVLGLVTVLSACASSAPGTPKPAAPTIASSPTPTPVPTPGSDGRLANLEIAAIYSGRPPDLTGYDPSRLRTLVVTGDVVPARVTNELIVHGGNFTKPWDAIRPTLQSGDVTLINLGDPLLRTCPVSTVGFTFCGDARTIAPMIQAGVNPVVNVANNHIGNYGQQGIDETVHSLQASGVSVSGFANIAVKDIRGVRFVFIGMDFVAHKPTHADLQALIAQARTMGDVVVAQIHAGHEYETYPEAGLSEDPKALDRLAIDSGADLVVGNFPHCAEGSEVYHGKFIAYAQGNFLFDQDWSIGTQESVVGRYYFYDQQLIGVQYVPVRVVNQTTPTPLDPTTGEGRKILDRLTRSSQEIAGLRTPFFPDLSDEVNACT